jgi:Dihydrodipicolinate synthase/N-acetylneuraminate lyase
MERIIPDFFPAGPIFIGCCACGRAEMMPGTGCCSIMETVKLTKQAVGNGCAGVLMLPPFYYKDVGEEGLYRYFSEVGYVTMFGDCKQLVKYSDVSHNCLLS